MTRKSSYVQNRFPALPFLVLGHFISGTFYSWDMLFLAKSKVYTPRGQTFLGLPADVTPT